VATFLILKIKSSEVSEITIEPKTEILNGSSGSIKIAKDSFVGNKINITIQYSDKQMNRSIIKYLLHIAEQKLEET
jgi:hypothetical protein